MDEHLKMFSFGSVKSDDNQSLIKFLPPEIRCHIYKHYMVQTCSQGYLIRNGYVSCVDLSIKMNPTAHFPGWGFMDAIESNNIKMLEFVSEAFVRNKSHVSIRSMLNHAIDYNVDADIMFYLIEKFADEIDTDTLSTVSFRLVHYARIDVMEYLEARYKNEFLQTLLCSWCLRHIRCQTVFKWMEQREFLANFLSENAWLIFKTAINFSNSLDLISYIYDKYKATIDGLFADQVEIAIFTAIGHNNVDLIKWMYTTFADVFVTYRSMHCAVEFGNLKLLQWLHDNVKEDFCVDQTFMEACKRGNVAIVKWLHLNREEIQQSRIDVALEHAIGFEKWDVVEFILDERKEVCSSRSFEFAFSRLKHTSAGIDLLLKIYKKNPSLYVDTNVVDVELIKGNLNMLNFLYKNMNMINIHQSTVNLAKTIKKRVAVMKWLKKRNDRYNLCL